MYKMIPAEIGGEPRMLNYSVAVMFAVEDRFGSLRAALAALDKGGKEGFEVLRFLAVAMANDGELARRELGEDPRPMLTESSVSARMSPADYAALFNAVLAAINAGYNRDVPDDEDGEVDLVLQELDEKKTKAGA